VQFLRIPPPVEDLGDGHNVGDAFSGSSNSGGSSETESWNESGNDLPDIIDGVMLLKSFLWQTPTAMMPPMPLVPLRRPRERRCKIPLRNLVPAPLKTFKTLEPEMSCALLVCVLCVCVFWAMA